MDVQVLRQEVNAFFDRIENAYAEISSGRAVKGKPIISASRRQAMRRQGEYLGKLRRLKLGDPFRKRVQAIAEREGTAEALRFLKAKGK